MKTVRIYSPARNDIIEWPESARKELGAILTRLQKGEAIGMPDVRPMPLVSRGASEIRIKMDKGIYRAFLVIETEFGILVFHSFQKKSQKTPQIEIETGKTRLRAFLEELRI